MKGLEIKNGCKKSMETYRKTLDNKPANKDMLEKIQCKERKRQQKTIIPSLNGMGHHAVAWESTSQWMGGAMAQWRNGGEGG